MGSMIHLAVGRLEIDWGKNHSFTDHSALFQLNDFKKVPYYYVGDDRTVDGDREIIAEYKDGYSKPLHEVVDRIKLLGHTLQVVEQEFEFLSELNDFDLNRFSFQQLKKALETVDVTTLSLDYGTGESFGKFFRRELFPRLGLSAILDDAGYVEFNAGEGMENLSAYSIIQLLAANPSAAALPVMWAFADLAENGWANRSEFVRNLAPSNRFLIVTEGTSDSKIIQKAFSLLKPHVADFFHYVDMKEGYPFTGTGSLVNFVKGLISIGVQNNIIVLFDNDAEGVASFNRCAALNIPGNMKVLTLPLLPKFARFLSVGPNGEFDSDINGLAAAIECYLDLPEKARVRWNNFNPVLQTYQGALEGKEQYSKSFLSQRKRKHDYDYSGIAAVLDLIIESCIVISQANALSEMRLL